MKYSPTGFGLALLVLAGCQMEKPGRSIVDVGTGSGAGVAAGGFRYLDEGIGSFGSFHAELGEGKGTNYDGIIGSGGMGWDPKTGEVSRPMGISGGITHRVGDHLGVFAGVAVTFWTTYFNYYNSSHILDPNGNYNVTGEEWTDTGFEIGGHFLISDKQSIGIRVNTATDTTLFTIGWGF